MKPAEYHVSNSVFALAIGVVALSVGCTVGPDYRAPVVSVPSSFGETTETEHDLTTLDRAAVEAEVTAWWAAFGDEQLRSLVERAVVGSPRIQIALERVEQARAARRARAGRLLPTVGASGSGGRSKASANGPGPLAGLAEAGLASLENELYAVGFEVGWEVDLFGAVRRGREAAQARLEASEDALRGSLLLLAAEVADAYVELRGAELRLRLAQRNLDIQQDALEVIEAKVDSGLLPPIDVERTRTERASLVAALAPLRAQRAGAAHRLAVLVGEPPAALLAELEEGAQHGVPESIAHVDLGAPADLLLRRPDLRAAERELQAATAELGAAIADRYPSIRLGGSYGLEAASLSDLLESASRTWSFGPSFDLPIFQGGRLSAQVDVARSRLRQAEAEWRLAVLRSLEEVESGVVGVREARAARTAWAEAAASSRRTSELAGVLYDLGLRDHLVLLDAQRSQTAIEDALAVAQVQVARSTVALYRALGGGWQGLEQSLGQAWDPAGADVVPSVGLEVASKPDAPGN